jgi:TM2 domain-containing membrane protein YozV
LALVNASKFTLDTVKYLGISEIIVGLIAAYFVGYGLYFWAFGFGILHIVYGGVMYLKERNSWNNQLFDHFVFDLYCNLVSIYSLG